MIEAVSAPGVDNRNTIGPPAASRRVGAGNLAETVEPVAGTPLLEENSHFFSP